jgi:tetratricopeptide (TPR) repeat protein
LEHVFRAYRDSGRLSEAETFIAPFLNDAATPSVGYAILAVSYAAMKRKQGDYTAMFATYKKMIQVAPTYEWTSAAYYWFALRAWRQGNSTLAATNADKMLLALGNDLTMYWKLDMAACALCLKTGLNLSQIPAQATIPAAKLQAQLNVIQTDLSRLNT